MQPCLQLLLLAQNYGLKQGGAHATGDANLDGAVNFADPLILAQEYEGSTAAAPAPEPFWMAAAGLPMPLRRRRRQAK